MSTALHLRRARLRLTLTYAAVMAVVLVVMALGIVQVDLRLRETEASGELLEAAQRAAADVKLDPDGDLDLTVFRNDQAVREGYPQTWVLAVAPEVTDGLRTVGRPYEDWFDAPVEDVAAGVVWDEATWMWDFELEDEPEGYYRVVARGIPIVGVDGEAAGAVVAVADADDWLVPHSRLRTTVFVIAGGLVLASAVAGYFLAGRALRPAAAALTQQEQLIADAAHELRTPMARIRAAAEGGLAEDEPAAEALERVHRVASDAGTLVDDLLVLARMDAGQEQPTLEPLRLDLLVEAEAEALADLVVETVETVVMGDAGLLRRAVHNLVTNAFTHGVDGGAPEVKVTVYPSRVVVTDRGAGIDPAVAADAFERFRAGPDSRGHGLGLAIVAWIARAHGGRATIGPREGGGTEAQIILPAPADRQPTE